MNNIKKIVSAIFLATSTISAFADVGNYPVEQVGNSIVLDNYTSSKIGSGSSFDPSDVLAGKQNKIRLDAVKDTAASLGARLALKERMSSINNDLSNNAGNMDKIFNFSSIVIDSDVLPPVISEANDTYNQSSQDEVRVSDKIYKIEKDSRFVAVTPTWRDYFRAEFGSLTAEMPHKSMLPKNAEEKQVWDVWLKNGWNQGVKQANDMFTENMSLLKRDYNGMLRYKALYKQGVVSKPYIARTNMGVTGGGRQLNIEDKVYRITDHSSLNVSKDKWMYQLPHSK